MLGAFAFIAAGLLAAIWYRPTTWGDIAGPLFSLGSGLLFVVALLLQYKDHQQAIAEMDQANRNHAELALIARQEKEFSVVTQAIAEFREFIAGLRIEETVGKGVLVRLLGQWRVSLTVDALVSGRFPPALLRNDAHANPLPHLQIMLRLRTRRIHLQRAVDKKNLQPDDREYLQELLNTAFGEVDEACKPYLDAMCKSIQELLSSPALLEKLGVVVERLKWVESVIQQLARVEFEDIPVPPTPADLRSIV